MMTDSEDTAAAGGKRLCWCYQHEFRGNPIALQALVSLAGKGWSGVLIDGAEQADSLGLREDAFVRRRIRVRIPRLGIIEIFLKFLIRCLLTKADVYVASQPLVCFSAWFAARIHRRPVVYYSYEVFGEEDQSATSRSTRLLKRLERFLLRRVDAVIVSSEERRDLYVSERASPPARTWVVHDIISVVPARPQGVLRRRAGIPEHTRDIIIYTGALQSGRCIPEVIEGFSLLGAPDTALVFVGRDTEPAFWAEQAAPVVNRLALGAKVHHVDWVPPEELPAVIADATIGVVLYATNQRGLYHATASRLGFYISQGVPVIVPPFPYLSRVVRDGGIGVVASDCSPAAIAMAMRDALQLAQSDLSTAFENARRKHDWQIEFRNLTRILEGISGSLMPTSAES